MRTKQGKEYHHPLIVRVTHWLNFVALILMVSSGLRIFNASPLFNYRFPHSITLGGWLGGARQWHFAAMWLFVLNGVIAVTYNIISRHGRTTTIFRRSDFGGLLPMIRYYLRLSKEHPVVKKYNSLQKLAYTTMPFVGLGVVLSGLAMYMPVTFQEVAFVFGGYDLARWFHFLFMCAIVFFFFGHIFMVSISGWANFWSMISGWKRVDAEHGS